MIPISLIPRFRRRLSRALWLGFLILVFGVRPVSALPIAARPVADRFKAEFGAPLTSEETCYTVYKSFNACFAIWENGELALVEEAPRRPAPEHDLTESEYEHILARLARVEPLGDFISEDREIVRMITNSSYRDTEEWENAIVERSIRSFRDPQPLPSQARIRVFTVRYFTEVSGIVGPPPPADCLPQETPAPAESKTDDIWELLRCAQPSLGPVFLEIGGKRYHLAAEHQRSYELGERVSVQAAPLGAERSHGLVLKSSDMGSSKNEVGSEGTLPRSSGQ